MGATPKAAPIKEDLTHILAKLAQNPAKVAVNSSLMQTSAQKINGCATTLWTPKRSESNLWVTR